MTQEINWDAFKEDSDPRFAGVKIQEKSSVSAPTVRVANRSPRNPEGFKPGLIVKTGKGETTTKKVVDTLHAVILLYSHKRSLFSATKGLVCASDDGHYPSRRIKEPQCRKASAADVAKVLKGFKGMEEVRLKSLVGELTENTDTLHYCGLAKSDGTAIPICPMARRDELGGKPPCKPQITLSCYDLDTNSRFYLVADGASIRRDKEVTSSLWKYLEFLGKSGVPCYNVAVTLTAVKGDNGFYSLGVSDYTPLENEELRATMKNMAEKELEFQEKRMCVVEGEMTEKTPEEKVNDSAAETFGDDDIQFA